jgi:hypothetical protein
MGKVMANTFWFLALSETKQALADAAGDARLTEAARSRALMLSNAHPSADLVALIANNPRLCFAKWRACLVQTRFLVCALAAFEQGSPNTQSTLLRLANLYPTPSEIRLLCYSQCGYAARTTAA